MSDEKRKLYFAKAQRIQAGVGMLLKYEPKAGEPKHLVTGNSMRAVDHTALVALLIRKGVITMEEYEESLQVSCDEEIVRYEEDLTARMGAKVKLATLEEVQGRDVEIEEAILGTGEHIPAHWLICPECKAVDVNTMYNPDTKEFRDSAGHTWSRPSQEKEPWKM